MDWTGLDGGGYLGPWVLLTFSGEEKKKMDKLKEDGRERKEEERRRIGLPSPLLSILSLTPVLRRNVYFTLHYSTLLYSNLI